VQMIQYHLAPGILQYYFETMTEQDYPVASTSGAAYTYPNLHPDEASYMRYSEAYMQLTGMEYIFTGLCDPYRATYFLHPEDQRARSVDRYRQHLPSAKGILHGYGGGGLHQVHAIESGQTPVVCTTAHITKKQDFKAEIEKLIARVDHRPLFISVHTGDNTPPAMVRDACRALQEQGHEAVQLDEWFAKLKTAVERGWLTDGLYPGLDERLAAAGRMQREHWHKAGREHLRKVLEQALLPDEQLAAIPPGEFLDVRGETQPKNESVRTVSTLDDDLSFAVLMAAQVLAGSVARPSGCSSEDLAELANHFRAMADVEDIEILAECLEAWIGWEEATFTTEDARNWARRLLALLPRLDEAMGGM